MNKTDKVEFGIRDKVLVTYCTKWYNIQNVPGVILRSNRTNGWPFQVRLEDEKSNPINLGHNDELAEPGSGPFLYCKADHLILVEKYVPKRLEGTIKTTWKVGDRFTPKVGFGLPQDEEDDKTGVVEEMAALEGKELTVATILPRLGVDWMMDSEENYCWLKEWMDPIE